VPTALLDMLQDDDAARVRRVTEAMLRMVKLDITVLRQAWADDQALRRPTI
jgi:hypothetical protein